MSVTLATNNVGTITTNRYGLLVISAPYPSARFLH
jgi:hypothetical protein